MSLPERAKRSVRLRYADLLNDLPLPVLRSDSRGSLVFANRAAKALFGDDLLLKRAQDLYSTAHDSTLSPASVKGALRSARDRQLRNVTVPTRLPDGTERELLCFFTLDDADSSVTAVLVPQVTELHGAIGRISDALMTSPNLESVLRSTTEEALRLSNAYRAYIKLYDPARNVLVFRALASRRLGEVFAEESAPCDRGMTGWVFTHKQPKRSGNVGSAPNDLYYGLFPDTVSKLVVPLLYQESSDVHCYGVLAVDGKDPDQFGVDMIATLTILAKHAAAAIGQVHLLDHIRIISDQLVNEVRPLKESLGVRDALHDTKNCVRDALSVLEEIDRDFLSAGMSRRRQREWKRQVDRVRESFDLITLFIRLFRSPQQEGKSDLRGIASQVVDVMPSSEIKIRLDAEPHAYPTRGAPRQYLLIFYNLLSNAVAAIKRQGSSGDIIVSLNQTPFRDGFWRILISDNGPGVPKELLNRLRRGEAFTGAPGGSGLGILSVQETVKELRGSFAIDSTLGDGTRITIDVPMAKGD